MQHTIDECKIVLDLFNNDSLAAKFKEKTYEFTEKF